MTMATNARRKTPSEKPRKRRPAFTPEERENQLIAIAVDVTEKQMLDGTATSQQITHYLKLGSSREQLEQQRLLEENKLLRAKVEQIESGARIEDLYQGAIRAIRGYKGEELDDEEYDEYDD
jgi:hypothetical protein